MQKIWLYFLMSILLMAPSSQAAEELSTAPDIKAVEAIPPQEDEPTQSSDKPDKSDKKEKADKPTTPAIPFKYDPRTDFKSSVPVRVKKVVDSTAVLSDKGDIYALTGLDIPDDNITPPKTQQRLLELTEGKKCTLYQTRSEKTGRVNRLNQIVGHLTCGKDENWVQGTLIAEGLARVRTTPENRNQAAVMLDLEQKARAKKLGLWAMTMNTIYTPDTAAQHLNGFGLVEGKIYMTAQNKSAIFLNFTSDWKTDFSIGIPPTLRKDFAHNRIDPLSLRGKNIRVRGWIRNYNGPYIELDHAEQLEILPDTPKPTAADQPGKMAERIIEGILNTGQPESQPAPKQFLHSLGGNKAQSTDTNRQEIEKPQIDEPKAPVVEKPKLTPTRSAPNR